MKKSIGFLLVILLILSLIGCTRYTDNYFRRYRAFLNYSLGNFRRIEERSGMDNPSGFPGGTRIFREWELAFDRQNGDWIDVPFIFTNHIPMETSVLRGARAIAEAYFERDVIINYFDLRLPRHDFSISFDTNFRQEDMVNAVLDLERGMQLYTVTVPELVDNWGFTLEGFSISIERRRRFCSVLSSRYTAALENLIPMLRSLSAYLEQKEEIDFSGTLRFTARYTPEEFYRTSQIRFFGTYFPQSDSFTLGRVLAETHLQEDYLHVVDSFKTIVRVLADSTEQDQLDISFSLSIPFGTEEEHAEDWLAWRDWLNSLSLYDRVTDTFEASE